jgi:predicted nucleotidyltransferase
MRGALQKALADDPRIAYALLFGSCERGTARSDSDVDLALGLAEGVALPAHERGDLCARLETAAGRPVGLVLLSEAPPGLAYRIFRDGRVIVERDRSALVERRARAILEYLDYQPFEELFTRGVLRAAAHGR